MASISVEISLGASRLLEEQDDLLLAVFGFIDFATVVRMQRVCKHWKLVIHNIIPSRLGNRMFTTREELLRAINKYYNNKIIYADELAGTYGWPIGNWIVSQITDFSHMFYLKKKFNEDISKWDMSNATKLTCMFLRASSFNQDLSEWDVSNVVDMTSMFSSASSFNGDISKWNTFKVERMMYMFNEAKTFNKNISSWDVSNVGNRCSGMLLGA
eukprot:CAMPEP_0178926314 /NCGR_PEP_ID=MMETSP0786-20121207/18460_1 /TAXON_ID=186022 /ORGANISM="Thalassionema frauenfeldii, Strain CCMP 1798" /LENGTH=213 /DNA_ID=CAMNT_0020601415 /DNA_START=59 /DNA_END=696 /DNA_ORIENTATION=+